MDRAIDEELLGPTRNRQKRVILMAVCCSAVGEAAADGHFHVGFIGGVLVCAAAPIPGYLFAFPGRRFLGIGLDSGDRARGVGSARSPPD
jgi:hypothetical protein